MSYNYKLDTEHMPMPVASVSAEGEVISFNEKLKDVFTEANAGMSIHDIAGVSMEDIKTAIEGGPYPIIPKNERQYKLVAFKDGSDENYHYTILFTDVTSWEDLKDRYNDEKPCICKVEIDNYDQLIDDNSKAPDLQLSSAIDIIIRKWAAKFDGIVYRIKGSNYHIWFEQRYIEKIIENKFELLDDVRALETTADFPASLSIGIGAGGKTLSMTESFAETAIDLALGRGGDQAVIKKGKKIEYFGGKLQTVEKSNKGKSRIVGHALRQLIEQSKEVFIMGHKYADVDSLGAAVGIYHLSAMTGKETYIVIDEISDSLKEIFRQVSESEKYNLINSVQAELLANEDSLVIVVDTNIPSLVQCPKLLEKTEKIAIIDHHRKKANNIENPVLGYIESYASSASELVTEILQYMLEKRALTKLEAEVLLAGIMIDTNNFSIKTGVRTLDAAAWLRRQGADPTEVKRFFQEDQKEIKIRAEALLNAEINNDIAITICEKVSDDAQIICAQIADMLLTIKGVKASFAVGRNHFGQTVISARSLGEVNVQLIMEKFGGGGHLTTAAAQIEDTVEEAVRKIKEIMEV